MIGLFVSFNAKLYKWHYMMHIKVSITARFITAYLASMIVSFFSFSRLLKPIITVIVLRITMNEIGVIDSSPGFRKEFCSTIGRAVIANPFFNKNLVNCIGLSANSTIFCYKAIWSPSGWLGNAKRKTRGAFFGATLGLSIGPGFKRLTANNTGDLFFFKWIFWPYPALKCTLGRAILLLTAGLAKDIFFVAVWAYFTCYHFRSHNKITPFGLSIVV